MPNLDISTYTIYSEQLGKTRSELETSKGQPLRESSEEGDTFYWYSSIVPHKAELYRFQSDKVVWVSIDVSQETLTVQDFDQGWSNPEFAAKKYKEVDPLQTIVVAWPSQGRAVIASGTDETAKVNRIEFFAPETVEQYLSNWGKNYADKERLTIVDPLAANPGTPQAQQTTQQKLAEKVIFPNQQVIMYSGGILLALVFGLVFFFLILNRFFKRT